MALGAVFLPSFLLVVGALPFWEMLRHRASFPAGLRGINAAVVGLLLAASTIRYGRARSPGHLICRMPALVVGMIAALGGALIGWSGVPQSPRGPRGPPG